MKKIYIIMVLVTVSLTLTFCEKDDTIINPEQQQTQNNKIDTSLKEGRVGLLFTYQTQQEYSDGITSASDDLSISDSEELIDLSGIATHIINKVNVANGVGLLTEKHYINVNTGKVVRSLILNTDSGEYDETNVNVPIQSSGVSPSCPIGLSAIGTCTKANGSVSYTTCIHTTVANYSLNNSVAGHCIDYQLAANATTTTVCAGPANCN